MYCERLANDIDMRFFCKLLSKDENFIWYKPYSYLTIGHLINTTFVQTAIFKKKRKYPQCLGNKKSKSYCYNLNL